MSATSMMSDTNDAVATIREVAEAAGVSVKTVSRMLSGHEGVKPKTRARIEAVMAEMNYFPSAAARSLRGHATGIVSLLTDSLTTTPDAFELVKGVQSVCEARGKLLMIGETGAEAKAFARQVDEFRRHRAEAILKATLAHDIIEVEQSFQGSSFVLINCFERPETRFPSFVPDDRGGQRALVEHLIDRGHRRIALLGLLPEMVATSLRLEGYLDAHRERGLSVDPELLRTGVVRNPDEFSQLGSILDGLLQLDRPPTAIACGNDKMALRALMILRARGVLIPEEVSLVGFDDYRLIADNLVPRLTTARLPYFEMGVRAVEAALDGADIAVEALPCKVVERESVALRTSP